MIVISMDGYLGATAELKRPQNTSILSFTLASTDYRQVTTWVRCSLFGKRGEKLAEFMSKGKRVWISGELTQRTYTARDGTTKESLDCNVNTLVLLGDRNEPSTSTYAPDDPIPF